MEYERIQKVQAGLISPSKLRMKLMGPHNQRKKDGSNNNSSRTSPSKVEDAEFVNSLLAIESAYFADEVKISGYGDHNLCRVKTQQFSKGESGNSSSVHPMRGLEDENLDYDSNASSSSFEFHKGDRSLHNHIAKSLLRPMSSKWNDAEKWIVNRQNVQSNSFKKGMLHSQGNRVPVRVAPESLSVKRVDFVSKDLNEVKEDLSCTAGVPGIRSVSMRDMGTEMTPIPSQEPSRTATPIGSTTPLRSPTSSMPSTPRTMPNIDDESKYPTESVSEQDLKLKTRKEIVALGVQLGKMNIAAWASKDDKDKKSLAVNDNESKEIRRIEFEKRAAAWEEAEKSKHTARFKREEIKIQAWESQQKAKLEAEMRRVEAEAEQIRAHSQARMVKKIAMTRQRSEEKRVAAETRQIMEAEKTVAQVEYICQTGRMPSSPYICCGWI